MQNRHGGGRPLPLHFTNSWTHTFYECMQVASFALRVTSVAFKKDPRGHKKKLQNLQVLDKFYLQFHSLHKPAGCTGSEWFEFSGHARVHAWASYSARSILLWSLNTKEIKRKTKHVATWQKHKTKSTQKLLLYTKRSRQAIDSHVNKLYLETVV